jgi:hypothetical protein
MLQKQQIWTFARRLIGAALLLACAFLFLFSVGSFLALRTENSADLHYVFIIFGYVLLCVAVPLEFVSLRFLLQWRRRGLVLLACVVPVLLIAAVSIQSIRNRNFTTTPGGWHHRHHWWSPPC